MLEFVFVSTKYRIELGRKEKFMALLQITAASVLSGIPFYMWEVRRGYLKLFYSSDSLWMELF